jgi:hypothetical protein
MRKLFQCPFHFAFAYFCDLKDKNKIFELKIGMRTSLGRLGVF